MTNPKPALAPGLRVRMHSGATVGTVVTRCPLYSHGGDCWWVDWPKSRGHHTTHDLILLADDPEPQAPTLPDLLAAVRTLILTRDLPASTVRVGLGLVIITVDSDAHVDAWAELLGTEQRWVTSGGRTTCHTEGTVDSARISVIATWPALAMERVS